MLGRFGNLSYIMWPNQKLVWNIKMLLFIVSLIWPWKHSHWINSNTRIILSVILQFRVTTKPLLCISVWDVAYLILLLINVWTIYTCQDDSRISCNYFPLSSVSPYLFSDLADSISQNKLIFRYLRKNILTWRTSIFLLDFNQNLKIVNIKLM